MPLILRHVVLLETIGSGLHGLPLEFLHVLVSLSTVIAVGGIIFWGFQIIALKKEGLNTQIPTFLVCNSSRVGIDGSEITSSKITFKQY